LCRRVEALFAESWPELRRGRIVGRQQPAGGSFHRRAEKEPIMRRLPLGWDSPVAEVAALGRVARARRGPSSR
jgi:hypothetical protein